MAKKKALDIQEAPRSQVEEPAPVHERTWKEWLRQTYSKRWFLVLSLLIDAWIPLQIWVSMRTVEGGVLAAILEILMIILQIILFRRWWPSRLIIEKK